MASLPHMNPTLARIVTWGAVVLTVVLFWGACRARPTQQERPADAPSEKPTRQANPKPIEQPATTPQAPHDAPTTAFVAPQPFQLSTPGAAPIAPPDLSKETWRAFVNQYSPHQKKTPKWQPLPASERVELAMPPQSRFRCVVQPVSVTPLANDFSTVFKGWSLLRTMQCSSDGFATWTEYAHRARMLPNGTHEVEFDSEALLREHNGEHPRETVVRMRTREPRREATTGPPRILEGVEVKE